MTKVPKMTTQVDGLSSYASDRVFQGVRVLKGVKARHQVIRAKAAAASLPKKPDSVKTLTEKVIVKSKRKALIKAD